MWRVIIIFSVFFGICLASIAQESRDSLQFVDKHGQQQGAESVTYIPTVSSNTHTLCYSYISPNPYYPPNDYFACFSLDIFLNATKPRRE